MYYKYIDILIKAFAADAKSIIDVGSSNMPILESFFWIKEKYTLDIDQPYSSPNVQAIKADFLQFSPKQKYDFAICLQVLEHVEEAKEFSQRLFDLSDRVLISVPYQWPKGSDPTHIHDPVTEDKLLEWTGREPNYSIVVEEPIRIPSKNMNKRLICYYDVTKKGINYKNAHLNIEKLSKERNFAEEEFLPEKYTNSLHSLLHELKEKQDQMYRLFKMELEIFSLTEQLQSKKKVNQKIMSQIQRIENEIEKHRRHIHREKKLQRQYTKRYHQILQSNSWRWMRPMRMIGSFLRKVFQG